eukprot:gene10009-2183_t
MADIVKEVKAFLIPTYKTFEKYLNSPTKKDPLIKTLAWIEKRTGIKRIHAFIDCAYHRMPQGIYINKLTNRLVLVAIESEEKEDDTQWLIYWVIYSTFTIAEVFVGTVPIVSKHFGLSVLSADLKQKLIHLWPGYLYIIYSSWPSSWLACIPTESEI